MRPFHYFTNFASNDEKTFVPFRTQDGHTVPAVTAAQMRKVDRIAMEKFGIPLFFYGANDET